MRKKVYIIQHDETDCAAAVLATISNFYGKEVTISKLRDILGTDIKGTNLNGLISGAIKLNFDAKALRISIDSLLNEKILTPFIAHIINQYNMSHFIVVYKIEKNKILVSDPSCGKKILSTQEFSNQYDGVVVLLKPNDDFSSGIIDNKGVFSKFLRMLLPHKKIFITAIIGSFMLTLLGIASNFFNQILIDEILPYNLKNQLNVFAIGFLIISLVNIALSATRNHLLLYLSQKIDIPLTLDYYKHIFSLPMKFFGTRKTGDILTRFQDAQTIKNVLSGIALTVIIDSTMVIITGVILYFMNVKLFAIVLIATLINILLIYIFKKPYKTINLIQMEQSAKMNSSMIDSLRAIETIKANGIEEEVIEKIENNFIDLIKTSFKEGVLSNTQQSISGLIGAVINVVMLWMGANLVMNQNITLGALMAFISIASFFMNPIGRLISLQIQVQESQIAMKRLTEIYEVEPEENKNGIILKNFNENIKFENVFFRYSNRKLVIDNVSFEIKKGQKIAIVGESGSGKTTIAKLILRLMEIESGKISIANNNINHIDFKTLRNKVAYVNQNIQLFSGTIYENFKLVNFNIDNETIKNYIDIADAHFIDSFPSGIDTFLEEAGANLSGGERQKIAIARALIKDFDILIFDEATSNLDFLSERKIYNNLLNSNLKQTMIFIAHRLNSIKNVDCIFVMDNGKLVEIGNHDELIKNKGKYFELWNLQNGDFGNFQEKKVKKLKINEIKEGEITYE